MPCVQDIANIKVRSLYLPVLDAEENLSTPRHATPIMARLTAATANGYGF
jgi:hypothetical protein